MKKLNKVNQIGFTLIELLVVAPVMILTIIIMMSFLFNQYGQLTQEGARLKLVTNAQIITLNIEDDVYLASSFVSQMNNNLQDSYAPSGGWRYNTTPQTFIISAVALTTNSRNPARKPVYINTVGCDPSVIENNSELQNNVIYFVQGTKLYKRILTAPPSLQTCGTSYEKQTCPTANVTATCPTDKLMTDKLNSFSITYYDSSGTATTVPEQAQKVKISVQLKDKAFAEDVYGDANITVKKLN